MEYLLFAVLFPSADAQGGLILFPPLIFSGDFPAVPAPPADRRGRRRHRRTHSVQSWKNQKTAERLRLSSPSGTPV
nr:MAG TPA: hypothetical protein [Caudoviricetes sp.]